MSISKLLLPLILLLALNGCVGEVDNAVANKLAIDSSLNILRQSQTNKVTHFGDTALVLSSSVRDALSLLEKNKHVTRRNNGWDFYPVRISHIINRSDTDFIKSVYRTTFIFEESEIISIEIWRFDFALTEHFEANNLVSSKKTGIARLFHDESNRTSFHLCSDSDAILIRYMKDREMLKDYDIIRGFLLDCGCY